MKTNRCISASRHIVQKSPLLLLSIIMSACLLSAPSALAKNHADEYRVGYFSSTGQLNDGTIAQCQGNGCRSYNTAHNIHYVRTKDGMYAIEAPIAKGMSILSSLATDGLASDVHQQWFMDQLHEGDKVLFAYKCNKHNNCTFWLPSPDKEGKEYGTYGYFRPDAAQTNTRLLCGKGKLAPDVEAEVCPPVATPYAKTSTLQTAPPAAR
jgi:hypothetical protein